jgi:AraC-like DNA-binding protein
VQDVNKPLRGGCSRQPSVLVPNNADPPFIPLLCQWQMLNGYNSAEAEGDAATAADLQPEQVNLQSIGPECTLIHQLSRPKQLVTHSCTNVHERPVLAFRARLMGRGRVKLSQYDYTTESPCVYFAELINPGSVVSLEEYLEPGEVACFMVSEDRLRVMLDGMRVPRPIELALGGRHDDFQITSRMSANIRRLFMASCSTLYTGDLARLYLNGKFFEVMAGMFDEWGDGAESWLSSIGTDRKKVAIAIDILLADLAHPPTQEVLSRAIGLSQRRLAEVFREVTGKSVTEWVVEQKLAQAADLLRDGSMMVKEVAFQLGYAHLSTFTTAFSRRFGVAPARYRDSVVSIHSVLSI